MKGAGDHWNGPPVLGPNGAKFGRPDKITSSAWIKSADTGFLDELGRGATGVVYRAQDPAIGRIIAIKTIRLSDFTDESERERLRERLFREAQSAGMLSHPNIVTIYDIAEENGLAYIFMECVDGPPLEKVLNGAEPISSDKRAFHPAANRHRAGLCAPKRHRPSRYQAREHSDPRTYARQDHGLRRSQNHVPADDAKRRHDGDAELHVARAGTGACRGRTRGSVFAGRDCVRNADRRKTVSWPINCRRCCSASCAKIRCRRSV